MHARIGMRGQTLDCDGLDMHFERLPAGAAAEVVTVALAAVAAVLHIDPGEF